MNVEIRTGSRLHFGLLEPGPQQPHRFGGVGMMIDHPGFLIQVEPSATDEFDADAETRRRVQSIVERCRRMNATGSLPAACRIRVVTSISAHAGLGSGTQLALGIGRALMLLAGDASVASRQIARDTGRGRRSGIGSYGFDVGGFLVDGGRTPTDGVLVRQRIEVPGEWRFVIVTPHTARGLSGRSERDAFASLEPMSAVLIRQLRNVIGQEIVPSLCQARFERFAAALHQFGRAVGEHFAPIQGGVFADPTMADVARRLRERGCACVVQSSWGPTICAPCADEFSADNVVRFLNRLPVCRECTIRASRPLNHGAGVTIEA